ncbi:MAG TPA: hypothetical protein VER98_07565 [Terriglobia bacterium]|nr:hypothetical protein [Terriglobia bacterium]
MAHPQVAAFARLANGGAKPTRAIAGQNTLFTRTIHDMAYDNVHDEIIVPSFYAFAILTFRGDANGNAAPVRKIWGPHTRLKNPQAVAVDGVHGEIFVPQGNQVLVFPREADGDVAPIRVVEGPDTGLGAGRVTIDPVHNLMITASASGEAAEGGGGGGGARGATRGGSGGRRIAAIRIFDRMANGNAKPLRVITGQAAKDAWLMTMYPEKGVIFAVVRPGNTGGLEGDISGRYLLDDYVGVWSVFDEGDVPPRLTIGGPDLLLKDARGIAVDPKSKDVMVSDKTLNAIFRFHVPEAFN